jgi:hypothetical protein
VPERKIKKGLFFCFSFGSRDMGDCALLMALEGCPLMKKRMAIFNEYMTANPIRQ